MSETERLAKLETVVAERTSSFSNLFNLTIKLGGVILLLVLGAFGLTNFYTIPKAAEEKAAAEVTKFIADRGLEEKAKDIQRYADESRVFLEGLRNYSKWNGIPESKTSGDGNSPRFRVVGADTVQLRGQVELQGVLTRVGKLPPEARPQYEVSFLAICDGTAQCFLDAKTTGELFIRRAEGPRYAALDGIELFTFQYKALR